MAQEANRPIYCIAHTGLIPTPIIPILYISYLGFIVIVTSHCQSHVPHALVSFHLTRLYMQRTSVQNWWCHHDTSHFGLANFNPIHVNSDISMCAMSTARSAIFATLESHSWLVILCHVTCTSTPLQQSAASAIVTMSLVSIILSEPTLTWADLTQIQHLLNRTFDYNWPLTFLALITNFDFDQLSKVHFSFFNWVWVYFSIWLLHPSNLIISPFGFTYTQNLPTHSHIHSILGRIHDPSNAAIHGHFHVSFNASSRDLPKFIFQTQDIVKALPWVWESVEDINLLWVTMCNGTRGPIHGIFHTKFKQFIIYTWKEYKE